MITTVTMNASIDKAYYMDGVIENGTVMRVRSCKNTAGGKGLNVARVAMLCGSSVQATGLVGGFNGKYLESMLEKDGVKHRFCHVEGETRSCINILDQGFGSTEYLEPGFEVSEEEAEKFFKAFPEIIKDSEVITISGSIPKGLKKDVYGKLIRLAKKQGKQVILDSSGDTLRQGMKEKPTMVKPNQDEIEALFDIKLQGLEDVIRYARKIYEMGIPYVVVSLGKDGSLMVCEEGLYHAIPPKVEAVNTVGCGDSMVGGFAAAFVKKLDPKEALRYASAVATANAMSPDTGNFAQQDLENVFEKVIVEKL